MWWGRPDPLDVYLSETRLWVAGSGGAARLERHTDALDAWRALGRLPQLRGRKVSLWLGGGLCRPMMLSPTAGTRDRDELEWALTSRERQRGGIGPGEVIRWLEQGVDHTAALCVVVKEELLSQAAGGLGTAPKVSSIKPWWTSIVPKERTASVPRTTWNLTAFDGESTTLLHIGAQARVLEVGHHGQMRGDDEVARHATRWSIAHRARRTARYALDLSRPSASTATGDRLADHIRNVEDVEHVD